MSTPEHACERALTIRDVQEATAEHYGVTRANLIGPRRTQAVCLPRQIAMYLSRKLCDASYPDIGRAFGNRDHSTVMHACKRVVAELRADEATRGCVGVIETRLLDRPAGYAHMDDARTAAGGSA